MRLIKKGSWEGGVEGGEEEGERGEPGVGWGVFACV